jgi:hypothetical protein
MIEGTRAHTSLPRHAMAGHEGERDPRQSVQRIAIMRTACTVRDWSGRRTWVQAPLKHRPCNANANDLRPCTPLPRHEGAGRPETRLERSGVPRRFSKMRKPPVVGPVRRTFLRAATTAPASLLAAPIHIELHHVEGHRNVSDRSSRVRAGSLTLYDRILTRHSQ